MNTKTMRAISISTGMPRTTQLRFVVAGVRETTAAELWVRTLAGEAQARSTLLARIMPQPRS
jgi:hypothetical protein